MTRACPVATPDLMLSLRLELFGFFIFRWFIPVWPRRILPLPVISNRLAAVFLVLIFGTFLPRNPPRNRKERLLFYCYFCGAVSDMGERTIVIVLPSMEGVFSTFPIWFSTT